MGITKYVARWNIRSILEEWERLPKKKGNNDWTLLNPFLAHDMNLLESVKLGSCQGRWGKIRFSEYLKETHTFKWLGGYRLEKKLSQGRSLPC